MGALAAKIQKELDAWYRADRGLFPLSELMRNSARDFGTLPALRSWNGKGYTAYTYSEVSETVDAVARWLIDFGLERGGMAAVLGENRPEWATAYLAIQTAGGTVVPVDRLLPSSGIRHIISDSGASILFVSGQLKDVIDEMADIPGLKTIVCFDSAACNGEVVSWHDVVEKGKGLDVELPKREMDELAALLYTSGTTGHSKGVMLSQKNIMSNVASCSRILPLGPDDTFLSVLPVHHSYEATAGFLLPLYCGCSITYARSLKSNELLEDMKNTNVTIMLGVPLLFEKMHQGVVRGLKKKGKAVQTLFNTLYGISSTGERMNKKWGRKLFQSIRTKAGMGTVKWFISGGGPLDPEDSLFFNRLGLHMMQGFGLTETSPVTHLTPQWRIRHDCIGPPIPDVEHKLIDVNEEGVGELCLRGPNIFEGYFKNPEATAEVKGEDGWFRTGDLAIIHEDNYVQITGRRKNMLVTGGGKNVYPEEIEYHLNRSLFIAESLVLGVPREKGRGEEIGALVVPDYEQMDLYFEEHDGQKPTSEAEVLALIKTEIKKALKDLEEYKQVRHLKLMQEEFQKT
ncbi:AMP-binding protein, partial [bacterium]|nr:AMP-binding protein [bacterium]